MQVPYPGYRMQVPYTASQATRLPTFLLSTYVSCWQSSKVSSQLARCSAKLGTQFAGQLGIQLVSLAIYVTSLPGFQLGVYSSPVSPLYWQVCNSLRGRQIPSFMKLQYQVPGFHKIFNNFNNFLQFILVFILIASAIFVFYFFPLFYAFSTFPRFLFVFFTFNFFFVYNFSHFMKLKS